MHSFICDDLHSTFVWHLGLGVHLTCPSFTLSLCLTTCGTCTFRLVLPPALHALFTLALLLCLPHSATPGLACLRHLICFTVDPAHAPRRPHHGSHTAVQ